MYVNAMKYVRMAYYEMLTVKNRQLQVSIAPLTYMHTHAYVCVLTGQG